MLFSSSGLQKPLSTNLFIISRLTSVHTPSQICSASFNAKVLYGPLEMLREKFRVISCRDGLSSQLLSAHVELHIFLCCQIVGCDHQLGSAVKEDNCGVCNGDGSTCRLVRGQYKAQLSASKRKLFLLVKYHLHLLVKYPFLAS